MSNIALRARRIACRAARKGSFIRILAHSFVFSLIFIRRFSLFSIKNAISVFLCNFMLIFQYASNTEDINYVRLPLFEPLFRPRGISLALPRHLRYASEAIRGALEKLQGTCGRLLMQLTGQRRRPQHSLRHQNHHLPKKKVDIYPGPKADIYPGKEPARLTLTR